MTKKSTKCPKCPGRNGQHKLSCPEAGAYVSLPATKGADGKLTITGPLAEKPPPCPRCRGMGLVPNNMEAGDGPVCACGKPSRHQSGWCGETHGPITCACQERNKRLAQTKLPDGTVIEREWTPRERYMLYVSGFGDGAAYRSMRPNREGLGAYDRGYADGRAARGRAATAYAKEVGYVPGVLRSADTDHEVGSPEGTGHVEDHQEGDD